MSTGEMQACLARLYVDEPFRRLFFLDPPAAIEGYRLTHDEAEAIRSVDHDLLEQFAASLVTKRRRHIERAYPLLFRLDGTEIRRYYARFYQLYGAKPYQPGHQEVADFGTFVEESLVNADLLPPYASELAMYERLYYLTAMSTAKELDDDTSLDQAEHESVTLLDARPSLHPDVTVADFAYDVGAIEEALQNDRAPGEIRPAAGGCSIIFGPRTGTSGVQMLRINAPTKALLDCCDGRRTVAQIVTDTEAALGAVDLRDRIVESLDRLLASHVLTLDAANAARPSLHEPGYANGTQVESM